MRFIPWFIVFLVFYVGFFILFQFGPSGFVEGAKSQFEEAEKLIGTYK